MRVSSARHYPVQSHYTLETLRDGAADAAGRVCFGNTRSRDSSVFMIVLLRFAICSVLATRKLGTRATGLGLGLIGWLCAYGEHD